jgi:single-strand DNA-binding protein
MPAPTVTVVGGVTADPEIKFTNSGKAMCRIRVAVKGRKKDAGGEWTDAEPYYFGVVAFGALAEHVAETVSRGTEVIIQGRMETNVWTDKEDREHRDLNIVAEDFGVSLRWDSYRKNERAARSEAALPGGATEQSEDAPF